MGIVDYAHTPDALEKTLNNLQKFRKPSQRIITIIGCGGDRDKEKRPKMASVSASLCDYLILTSDNPRTEKPESILKEMENGLEKLEKNIAFRLRTEEKLLSWHAKMQIPEI